MFKYSDIFAEKSGQVGSFTSQKNSVLENVNKKAEGIIKNIFSRII